MLIDGKDRRYLVRLEAGGEFHTHAGILPHDGIIGADEGALLRANSGVSYRVIRPTLTDFVLKMKRGAQVIYPKDLGPLLLLADVFPGARILESGVGSGALSMTLLRAGAEIVGYEVREDFAARAQANVRDFLGEEAFEPLPGRAPRLLRGHRRARPRPRRARPARALAGRPHATKALRPGGIIVAYTPSVIQVSPAPRGPRPRRFLLDRDPRGPPADLARRRPRRAPRPPHGGPHRLPHPRPSAGLTRRR